MHTFAKLELYSFAYFGDMFQGIANIIRVT